MREQFGDKSAHYSLPPNQSASRHQYHNTNTHTQKYERLSEYTIIDVCFAHTSLLHHRDTAYVQSTRVHKLYHGKSHWPRFGEELKCCAVSHKRCGDIQTWAKWWKDILMHCVQWAVASAGNRCYEYSEHKQFSDVICNVSFYITQKLKGTGITTS